MVRSATAFLMHVHPSIPFGTLVFALLTLSLMGCQKASESITSIALHPTNANILYVATNDAVYKSRDAGSSWEQFPSFSARRVTTLGIDPKLPATVYAGTMGDAVYKSPDGGQHWLPHNVGLKEHVSYVNQFIFHPGDNERIYAATTVGTYYTKDGGRVWEERMAGMKEVHIVVSMAIDRTNPRILYAGTTGGIYRSDDGAALWKKINKGLIRDSELMAAMALGVNVIVIDPLRPETVYAGTTKGLFQTKNRGETWERIGLALPDPFISSILVHPVRTDFVYIGGPGGVWKSVDGGQTVQAVNSGLATLNVRTLAMSPRNPEELYSGTNGSGLYHSIDGGESWEPLPLTSVAEEVR